MRTIVKWLLPAGLVVLLVIPFFGCGLLRPLVAPPALDKTQAAVLIQVYGVPYIDQYYEELVGEEAAQALGEIGYVTPTGVWAADYQGEGKWVIEGPVTTKSWGECSTRWTFNEADGKIRLTRFECD